MLNWIMVNVRMINFSILFTNQVKQLSAKELLFIDVTWDTQI